MSQLKERFVVSNPVSNTFYSAYTVPAGSTLFVHAAEMLLFGTVTSELEMVLYDSSITVALIETNQAHESRDFTRPYVVPAGTVLEVVWNGTGSPTALILDLLGTLA